MVFSGFTGNFDHSVLYRCGCSVGSQRMVANTNGDHALYDILSDLGRIYSEVPGQWRVEYMAKTFGMEQSLSGNACLYDYTPDCCVPPEPFRTGMAVDHSRLGADVCF